MSSNRKFRQYRPPAPRVRKVKVRLGDLAPRPVIYHDGPAPHDGHVTVDTLGPAGIDGMGYVYFGDASKVVSRRLGENMTGRLGLDRIDPDGTAWYDDGQPYYGTAVRLGYGPDAAVWQSNWGAATLAQFATARDALVRAGLFAPGQEVSFDLTPQDRVSDMLHRYASPEVN